MPFPRRYPPDLVDAVVQRVADARTVKAYGAVTAVARQLDLDPRLVQKWVNKATAPPPLQAERAADGTGPWKTYLSPGLMYCKFCHHPLTHAETADAAQAYRCGEECWRPPVDVVVIADHVGRAILRHAPRIVAASAETPTPPHLAAMHAHRILTRVTVGATARDITLTWRAVPLSSPSRWETERAQRVAAARALALGDPLRARQLLHDSLTGIDPATGQPHLVHAEAAILLTELHLRFGQLDAAIAWAGYAHYSTDHLYGSTDRRSLHALHLFAAAHRSAGHHQRAYHLYRRLGEHLASSDDPRGHRTLAVHAITALVLHDLGHCQAARNLLADTIATHRREHPGHPATARMSHHLARIWQECATKSHHHEDG
ncbi:CDC27 family protein [Micromonospora sp. NPDC047548]|uniref:CDC27 family protein n=1 Tax=Micromonospora sp. NPDC047548 TaxID=3155624 RepID=UPI0033F23B2D